MAVKLGIGRSLANQAASTTVDGCDAVREFDTFDDARQLVRALELAPRLHPRAGRIEDNQFCGCLRQRTFGAHRWMPDGGENGLDRLEVRRTREATAGPYLTASFSLKASIAAMAAALVSA
jgi:hypothetical protein